MLVKGCSYQSLNASFFMKLGELQNLTFMLKKKKDSTETNEKMVYPQPCDDPICRVCKCPVCYKPKTECNNETHKASWFT